MKQAKTKSALITSVLAMLLCVSMLVGTTFAWFTDTASTGVNKIQVGNLDIEVSYATVDAPNVWQSIENATSLFTTEKWEPGATEVVYLKVENKGSLALKYKSAITCAKEVVGVSANNDEIKLSEILKYGITPAVATAESYATREAARAAVAGNERAFNDYYASGEVHLLAGETRYQTLIVYMPEAVGNEANHKAGTDAPSIDIGLNFTAAQYEHESDSFGNDYDKNSAYVFTAKQAVTVTAGLKTTVAGTSETVSGEQQLNAGGINVTYPDGVLLDNTSTKAEGVNSSDATQGLVRKNSSSHNIAIDDTQYRTTYELTLPVSEANTTLVKVQTRIAANQSVVDVYHSGTKIAKAGSADAAPTVESFHYDSTTGMLTLWLFHASEIDLVTEDRAPVFTMFPNVDVVIVSDAATKDGITMTDAATRTSATIPASAVAQGVVKQGQQVHLVIKTTYNAENKATYDISLRDSNGNPFNWNTTCCPSVTYDMGDMSAGVNCSIYDGAAEMYLPYGKDVAPGWYYDATTGLTTICSTTFK